MSATVYVVTEGSYSDYHIVCLWSTREKAQAYIDACKATNQWNDKTIEEYSIDPQGHLLALDAVRTGLKRYNVHMWRDGTAKWLAECYQAYTPEPAEPLRVRGEKAEWVGPGDDDYKYWGRLLLSGQVWARDEQHALKIANEHRAMLIATDQWPEDTL